MFGDMVIFIMTTSRYTNVRAFGEVIVFFATVHSHIISFLCSSVSCAILILNAILDFVSNLFVLSVDFSRPNIKIIKSVQNKSLFR